MNRNADKTHKSVKPESTAMIIRVVAKCSKCGNKKTLYIDERIKDRVKYLCEICENDDFIITYR